MVEDERSWTSGGSYIERLGKLLGDLIDSKDDGGSVSCSNHTNDQGWKVSIWMAAGRNVVDEKEETEVVGSWKRR